MALSAALQRPLPATRLPDELDEILRATSRSIYLTLQVLPWPIRRQLMLGYLFCRAADTIADTRALPRSRRLEMLALYRQQFERDRPASADVREISRLVETDSAPDESGDAPGFSAAEGTLLSRLAACFEVYGELIDGDRALLRRLLTTLTQGMEMDLTTFPAEEEAKLEGALVALEGDADLDRYCYHVAGCVGEFWTELQVAHLSALGHLDHDEMLRLGVRFGKGLQMTNVLRDVPADLRLGRCYIPKSHLKAQGLDPADLLRAIDVEPSRVEDETVVGLRCVLDDLFNVTLDHLRCGLSYTCSIPRRCPRLRLACVWPLIIGVETLTALRQHPRDLLAGARLKVSRQRVYSLIFASSCRVFSNSALARLYQRLEINV